MNWKMGFSQLDEPGVQLYVLNVTDAGMLEQLAERLGDSPSDKENAFRFRVLKEGIVDRPFSTQLIGHRKVPETTFKKRQLVFFGYHSDVTKNGFFGVYEPKSAPLPFPAYLIQFCALVLDKKEAQEKDNEGGKVKPAATARLQGQGKTQTTEKESNSTGYLDGIEIVNEQEGK
jgi:hypothetical protein